MTQRPFKSWRCLFKKMPVAPGPESYLQLTKQCLEEVRILKILPKKVKINREQCEYLVHKLGKAVLKASLLLEHYHHYRGNSGEEETKCLELFKILYILAKEVESIIQGCFQDHWVQAAVMWMNFSDHILSRAFDLELFTILIPPYNNSYGNSWYSLTLHEVAALRNVEVKLVKERASIDDGRLFIELKAVIQSSQSRGDHCQLAAFLLERLDRFKDSQILSRSESSRLILLEKDLTSLKQMVQIGRGGYAVVHRAVWLGVEVAVKTFHGSDNPDFKKEVSILAGLSHPHIISFLCYGKDVGECFIVMELMDRDLYSLMKDRLRKDRTRKSPFTKFEELDIILQVAEAMEYLHEMRVLHRDLKSHNILVRCIKSRDGEGHQCVQVKVADFGLARTKEFSLTKSHLTPNMGTARWMAPELIKSRNFEDNTDVENSESDNLVKRYPFKTDVYSFGMVCLEILTGDVPFPDMRPNEVKRAVCAGERPELPDQCHYKLKALIKKCWNQEASERPSFGEICLELRHLKSLHLTWSSNGGTRAAATGLSAASISSAFVHPPAATGSSIGGISGTTGLSATPSFQRVHVDIANFINRQQILDRHVQLMNMNADSVFGGAAGSLIVNGTVGGPSTVSWEKGSMKRKQGPEHAACESRGDVHRTYRK